MENGGHDEDNLPIEHCDERLLPSRAPGWADISPWRDQAQRLKVALRP
jgi:hypothetical protein